MVEFIVTALEAFVLVVMAVLVYRSRRDNFLNRSFSLFLVFLASWVLCGFPHLLVSEPSSYYVTLEFHLAHCTGVLALGAFFLFSLSFLLGRKPNPVWMWSASLITLFLAFCGLSDLLIKSVTYSQGRFYITNGPLYPLFTFFVIVSGGGGFLFAVLKRHRSKGTDRARAFYILLGFGILLASIILMVILLPVIMGSDATSNYAFFLPIIPTGFTSYAILRHRLLDVRVAVRRSFAYLLTLLVFGAPLVAAYTIFRYSYTASPSQEMAISICVLALAVALSPTTLRWSNKIASRLFFSGMYDEVELLHTVSTVFTSTANIQQGLVSAASLICEKLSLSFLRVSIPDEATHGQGTWVIGSRRAEEGQVGFQEVERGSSPLYMVWDTLLVAEDSHSSFENDEDIRRALGEMKDKGIAACLPVKGPAGKMGVLMVGEKLNRMALDPLDLDFLSQFADRAGLFIENYLLSTYLLSQLEELSDTRKKLEDSDRFKTDIISVTSHEFRTPLTVLNGYAYMLRDHYGHFGEEERLQYIEYITASCDRLNAILDQFLTVSYFQKGVVAVSPRATPVADLFTEVKSGFVPEQSRRIESEVVPMDAKVLTDRSYLILLLKNLVENAIRFSPRELPVILKAEEKDKEIFISIQDFGEGIRQNEVQNIFQPFARLEETNKHRIGTGLGLYIVRLIADLLGTRVDIQSRPDAGTTFYFKLPQA